MVSAFTLSVISLTLISFIDDTELFVMSQQDDIKEISNRLQRLFVEWKNTLVVTGGEMRPEKCSWSLISFDYINGKYSYSSNTHKCIQKYSTARYQTKLSKYAEKLAI